MRFGILKTFFNISDSNYVSYRTDERFTWHIGNEVDTTVGNSDCAYDRILTTGDCTTHALDAEVFKFDEILGLSQEEALKISDHYPVFIRIE